TRVEGQPPTLAFRRSFRDISPSGVVGDARPGTAEKGEKLLGTAAERIAAMLGNEALWR
ncbi:MAG: creatininase family protein, partial [Acetobacteraceae bacterium]|nr:creatininase family protein [Acetobacteraceae bacterium]